MLADKDKRMPGYIEIDLQPDEKRLILELASFFVRDELTQADLKNGRKKWIRFRQHAISEIVGELSYHCNRSRSVYQSELLDALIGHIEASLIQR